MCSELLLVLLSKIYIFVFLSLSVHHLIILNHRKNEKKMFESKLQSAGIYDWLDVVLNSLEVLIVTAEVTSGTKTKCIIKGF